MDHPPPTLSLELQKVNVSKATQDASELMNFSDGREIKSQMIKSDVQSARYDHIPMKKPLPEWNRSASTLRHSASYHHFSKSARFSVPKSNYQDAQQHQIPSMLGTRSSGFGYGKKVSVPEVFSQGISSSTHLCPFYNIDVDGHKRSNSAVSLREGKTFGLGWKNYEPSRTPHRNSVHDSYQVKANPGPNYYSLNPEGKNTARKSKMHERLPMFSSLNAKARMSEPHPQSYELKEDLQIRNKRATALGYGQKTDFTKHREKSPGPIYKISGFTDKFTHLKVKMAQP